MKNLYPVCELMIELTALVYAYDDMYVDGLEREAQGMFMAIQRVVEELNLCVDSLCENRLLR